MMEYSKEDKEEHSVISERIDKGMKSEFDSRRNLKVRYFGLTIFYVVWASFNYFTEIGHWVIPLLFIPINVLILRYFLKKSNRRLDEIRTMRENLEDIGKKIYNTPDDEKLT